jgi:3-phosphoshikimate 1-carboxyvinyltransferase
MLLSLKGKKLRGTLRVPSDKSISHRTALLAGINNGTVWIKNFLPAQDCLNTLKALSVLGVQIDRQAQTVKITGKGKHSLKEPSNVLDLGNSGTSMRLLSGILAGQPFYTVLTGDDSLRARPMDRVAIPLREMGATILGRKGGKFPPITVIGKPRLRGIHYTSPRASAQVKSAILLAGLYTEERVSVTEPFKSRDHTERILRAFGVDVVEEGLTVSLGNNRELKGDLTFEVPADISSASFFIVGALIAPGSCLTLKDVLLNPTRTGILEVVKRMGATFHIEKRRHISGEEVADIVVEYSPNLTGVKITGEDVPRLIDELPVLALLATQAEGETIITGAKELRVKESDRIRSTVENLRSIGAEVEELEDGMLIQGKCRLKGGKVRSYKDHRIAMTFAIASLITQEPVEIDETECISTSYPGFFEDLGCVLVS